jgi:hypothetical protein
MLKLEDAGEELNRQIEAALSKPTVPRSAGLRVDCSTGAGVARIRELMEDPGGAGTIRLVRVDGRAAFVYLSFNRRGHPFAQGLGDSPSLAVVDAFLHWSEREGTHSPEDGRATVGDVADH